MLIPQINLVKFKKVKKNPTYCLFICGMGVGGGQEAVTAGPSLASVRYRSIRAQVFHSKSD